MNLEVLGGDHLAPYLGTDELLGRLNWFQRLERNPLARAAVLFPVGGAALVGMSALGHKKHHKKKSVKLHGDIVPYLKGDSLLDTIKIVGQQGTGILETTKTDSRITAPSFVEKNGPYLIIGGAVLAAGLIFFMTRKSR